MSIEFEGYYSGKLVRRQKTLVDHPSTKFLFRRLIATLLLTMILVPVTINVYQTRQYFTRTAGVIPFLAFFIYYLVIHPYIAPYFDALQASMKPKKESFRKGEISADGFNFISPDHPELIPWSKIYRAKKTDDLVVLFVDYAPSMAFPRNFFKQEADWQTFNRWVNYYVKDHS
jgi:hypothetical protein